MCRLLIGGVCKQYVESHRTHDPGHEHGAAVHEGPRVKDTR